MTDLMVDTGKNILFLWASLVCLLIIGTAVLVLLFSRKNVAALNSFADASSEMTSRELPMNNIAFELNRRFTETGQLLSSAIESGETIYLEQLSNHVVQVAEMVRQAFDGRRIDPELASIIERFGAYVAFGQDIALKYIEEPGTVDPSDMTAMTSEIIKLKTDLRAFQAKHSDFLDEKLNDIAADSAILSREHGSLARGVTLVAVLAIAAALAASVMAVKLLHANERLLAREQELSHTNIELKRHEKELRERTERLEDALAEISRTQEKLIHHERMDALGRMASGIAHDFNNVLTPILGYADILLANRKFDNVGEVERDVRMILSAALDGKEVVGRLKEFYKQGEGQSVEQVNVSDLLNNVVSLTKPSWKDQASAEGRGIKVSVEAEDGLGVLANRRQIHQVLANLIINAVDAMPDGGLVTLKGIRCGNDAAVSVCDTGDGMPPEVLERCWEPFYTTKGEEGTGMGLSLCRDIVERHKGRVEVESETAKGTTITLFLPYVGVKASGGGGPPEGRPKRKRNKASVPKTGQRILAVDDEPLIRDLLVRTLTHLGHEVTCAGSVREALELLKGNHFDLLITDKAMPDDNGDMLALAAKQLDQPLPVIMLTGFGDMMGSYGSLPEGVDLIVAKPMDTADLQEAIAEVLEQREEAGAA